MLADAEPRKVRGVILSATFIRLRAILRVDAREALCRCHQPMLYIASGRDKIVPKENIDEIARLRQSVNVVTISGRHLAMYTNPQYAAQAIANFIVEQDR
jgi:pimeloyl-ACP methyl ester carboxylesterase